MGTRNLIVGLLLGITLTLHFHLKRYSSQVQNGTPVSQAIEVRPVSRSPVRVSVTSRNAIPETRSLADKAEPVPETSLQKQRAIEERSLKQLLRDSIEPANVSAPTVNQLTRFETLMAQTLRIESTNNEPDPELVQRWNADGWAVYLTRSVFDPESNIMVITEMPDRRNGRGIYAIRLGLSSNVFLQSPHRFYDSQTGLITRKLFAEQPVKAVAWNSVHRRQIDLSHTKDHFINAFTRAIVTVAPTSVVAQIHGFGNAKQDAIDGDVRAIISNGTRFPDRLAIAVAGELKQSIGGQSVRLFPTEAEQLGGTRNRQGSLMRDLGSSGFLHLELDSKYRDQLNLEASKRDEFFRSFTKHRKLPY